MSHWLWQVFQVIPVILGAFLLVNNNSIATETSTVTTGTQQTEVLLDREVKLADISFAESVSNSGTETIPDQSQLLEQIDRYNNINSINQELENDPIGQVKNERVTLDAPSSRKNLSCRLRASGCSQLLLLEIDWTV